MQVWEGALRRDGAQEETRRFVNPLVASYLHIVLERAYAYLIYVEEGALRRDDSRFST
jgi:hypothetical protein